MNIRTDASDKGYGGYAFQDIEGKRPVLGFHSKTYTRAQRNYSAGERELLSIYKLIEVFHTILFGRHFTVYTDHLPLTFLFSKAEPANACKGGSKTSPFIPSPLNTYQERKI
jgi:putative transposase